MGSKCKGPELALLEDIFWGAGGNLEGALFEDLLEKEIRKKRKKRSRKEGRKGGPEGGKEGHQIRRPTPSKHSDENE